MSEPQNTPAHRYQALIDEGIVLPGFGEENKPDIPHASSTHIEDTLIHALNEQDIDAESSPERLQEWYQAMQQRLLTAIEIVEGSHD